MINYESILSAFDGKPTLLQWLKLIKKALDESVLKDITLKQDGASVVFTFNFEDGTSISTPAVTLPKGDTGAKGEQGVSVTGVDEVSDEVVGNQTLTTLRFHFSNGTNDEVVVYAENGKNGGIGVIINQPASATSGTLTADQLVTLQANDNNYIIFNNELYRLADKQHTAGVLSYTHTGWDGTAVKDKSINITISTLAWVLVQGESGGGKLYQHTLSLSANDGSTLSGIRYSTTPTKFKVEDMTNINYLFNKEVHIAPSTGAPKIYNIFYNIDDGDNLGAPDLMILGYYPTYPGDESSYVTKEFSKTSFNDSVVEL